MSLWKLLLFFILFLTLPVAFGSVRDAGSLFTEFKDSFKSATYTVTNAAEPPTELELGDVQTDWDNIPGKVLTVQIFCAYATYVFGKFACRTTLQRIAFALPLTLTAPSVLAGVAGMCAKRNNNECSYR